MNTLILLATHNGARFLPQQLASLAAQSDPDWRLLVRDDGSTDGTQGVLAGAARTDGRIELMPGHGRRSGPTGNFGQLMQAALARDEPAIALCDQDDVWLPDKIARQRERLATLEAERGAACPLLVHGDLEVVDEQLRGIHRSLMRLQLIRHPGCPAPLTLLAQNHVVGCTLMMNRALLALATPVPEQIYMHDWWIALCAAFAGHLSYIAQPLVRYRQHRDNLVGAQGVVRRLARPWLLGRWVAKMNAIHHATWLQAEHLCRRLRERPDDWYDRSQLIQSLEQLERFVALQDLPSHRRAWRLRRMGMRSQNIVMTTLYLTQALLLRIDSPERPAEPGCRR